MSEESNHIIPAFARVLRQLRAEAGLSQERLAEVSRLDRTFISLLERGQRQPSLSTLAALAAALGVTLAEIARRTEEIADHRGAR